MGQITGGVVSLKDGVKKTQEYAPAREVRVELRFDVADGEDAEAVMTQTAQMATHWLNKLVNDSVGETQVKPSKPPSTPRKPKDEPTKPKDEPKPAPEKPADELSLDDELPGAEPSPEKPKDEPSPEKPKDITDAEVLSAVSKRNGETKNAAAIKALVAEYSKSGRTSEIPQEKRSDFLAALAKVEVKKAA